MSVESATYVNDLNTSNPLAGDGLVGGDDHLRLIKAVMKQSFPGITASVYLDTAQTDVASASTCDIGAVASNYVRITGTTTVSAFGTAKAGTVRFIRFADVLTLTYHATQMILPGAASISTTANSTAMAISLGSGNWIVLFYTPASGAPVAIADASVTLAKLANLAQATVIGRAAAAGTGVPVALTGTQLAVIVDAFTGDSGSGGLRGEVPAPASGDTVARKFLFADGTWKQPGFGAPDVILEDQKSSGTAGGTFTSGADRTRVLNTEVRDLLSICTLSSNQFTLTAGTYYIEWGAPAWQPVGAHQSFLYDVTGTAELKRGTPGNLGNSSSLPNDFSTGQHVVTIAGSNAFEIRHRCTSTVSTNGFGFGAGFGTEIYTWVKIWKTA